MGWYKCSIVECWAYETNITMQRTVGHKNSQRVVDEFHIIERRINKVQNSHE